MFTELILTNNADVRVNYVTDLPKGATSGNFTIMEIRGLSDAEKVLGLDFQQLPSDLGTFTTWAEDNHLDLLRADEDGEVLLSENDDSSSSSS